MSFIADLHLHSKYAYACSKDLSIYELTKWGMLKGITVLATGDFTHPRWLQELERDLEPLKNGLFVPKPHIIEAVKKEVPSTCHREIFFMLETEVSCIYSKNDRVRKIHHLIYAPNFETVKELNHQLSSIGNLASDGRPILGLDSQQLLKIVIDTHPECYLVPAHAWTPHFAIFGSNSGFDSLEECFGDLTEHIFAIETGLSSDPEMNRLWSRLDNLALISGSDSHSAPRIGREANIFSTVISYPHIWQAIQTRDREKFLGTIEFYPHEGRYHYDGHRKCGVVMHPRESLEKNNLCPACQKPMTLGVLHRVEALADRQNSHHPENASHTIPLLEIVAEIENTKSTNAKKVRHTYFGLLNNFGPELEILLNVPIKQIEENGGQLLAAAIEKVRRGHIDISPGYDGLYGEIHVFDHQERDSIEKKNQPSQLALW